MSLDGENFEWYSIGDDYKNMRIINHILDIDKKYDLHYKKSGGNFMIENLCKDGNLYLDCLIDTTQQASANPTTTEYIKLSFRRREETPNKTKYLELQKDDLCRIWYAMIALSGRYPTEQKINEVYTNITGLTR